MPILTDRRPEQITHNKNLASPINSMLTLFLLSSLNLVTAANRDAIKASTTTSPEQLLTLAELSTTGKECIQDVFEEKECEAYNLEEHWKLAIRVFNCYKQEFSMDPAPSFLTTTLFFLEIKPSKCTDSMSSEQCLRKLNSADQQTVTNWLPQVGMHHSHIKF